MEEKAHQNISAFRNTQKQFVKCVRVFWEWNAKERESSQPNVRLFELSFDLYSAKLTAIAEGTYVYSYIQDFWYGEWQNSKPSADSHS
jgi:hypothetical protein